MAKRSSVRGLFEGLVPGSTGCLSFPVATAYARFLNDVLGASEYFMGSSWCVPFQKHQACCATCNMIHVDKQYLNSLNLFQCGRFKRIPCA